MAETFREKTGLDLKDMKPGGKQTMKVKQCLVDSWLVWWVLLVWCFFSENDPRNPRKELSCLGKCLKNGYTTPAN